MSRVKTQLILSVIFCFLKTALQKDFPFNFYVYGVYLWVIPDNYSIGYLYWE